MTALAADKPQQADKEGRVRRYPVEDNVLIYHGSLVSIDTSGYVRPSRDAASEICVGIAEERSDNTSTGPLGASHTAGGMFVRVRSGRTFLAMVTSGATQATVGATVYVTDSGTVATTATNYVVVGICCGYNSSTSIDVFIPLGPASVSGISGLTATAGELNLAHSVTPGVLAASKNVTTGAGGLVTGTAAFAITITGANLTLATATSGTLFLTSAGVITATGVGNSSITITSGSLSLVTATSGALVLTSAGAITVSSATASTWAATGGLTFSAGAVNLGSAASVAYAATMALVVASNTITVAASNGTSATATINCAATPAAGQTLAIITTADGTGTCTVTFGTNFKSTGTQATTLSHFSTISFVSDGTRWIEIARNTNQA